MAEAGVLAAAFAFGGAVGLVNNAISNRVHRSAVRSGTADASGGWPVLFAVQYLARMALSVGALYVVFRASGASASAVLAATVGLLLPRYALLLRLAAAGGDTERQR